MGYFGNFPHQSPVSHPLRHCKAKAERQISIHCGLPINVNREAGKIAGEVKTADLCTLTTSPSDQQVP